MTQPVQILGSFWTLAVGADPAIAHDREFLLAVTAAAKSVGDISEAIFVQRAGQ